MDIKPFPNKQAIRLKKYDYNSPGTYFITICTKNRKNLLSEIRVGTGVLDRPQNELTSLGKIADKQLSFMSHFYDNISVDKYVIMPNHIYLLLTIKNRQTDGRGRPSLRTHLFQISSVPSNDFATKNMVVISGKNVHMTT